MINDAHEYIGDINDNGNQVIYLALIEICVR